MDENGWRAMDPGPERAAALVEVDVGGLDEVGRLQLARAWSELAEWTAQQAALCLWPGGARSRAAPEDLIA